MGKTQKYAFLAFYIEMAGIWAELPGEKNLHALKNFKVETPF